VATLLGLAAALGWGLTDFLARLAGDRLGATRTMLFGQASAVLVLTLWLAAHPDDARRALGAPLWAWAAGLLAAQINLAGTYALIRGMTIGAIAVVAPVTASYGAIAAALAALSGEAISRPAWAGIGVTVLGVACMAWPAGAAEARAPRRGAAFAWALLSAISFGVGFWVQGAFAVPRLGAIVPVWLYYAASLPTLLLVLGRRAAPLPARRHWPILAGIGLSGAAAYLAFCTGLQTGALALVAVLSSLSSGISVLLAGLFLHERLAAHQWASVAVIIAGLMLINHG
jgi:drug/metabolite transporter (DMT)-like permease